MASAELIVELEIDFVVQSLCFVGDQLIGGGTNGRLVAWQVCCFNHFPRARLIAALAQVVRHDSARQCDVVALADAASNAEGVCLWQAPAHKSDSMVRHVLGAEHGNVLVTVGDGELVLWAK